MPGLTGEGELPSAVRLLDLIDLCADTHAGSLKPAANRIHQSLHAGAQSGEQRRGGSAGAIFHSAYGSAHQAAALRFHLYQSREHGTRAQAIGVAAINARE